MASSAPFKKVILIGAGGSIGSIVLQALLAEPQLETSILARSSSKPLPASASSATIIRIDDAYPSDALVAAFQGQDAVINCMTSFSVAEQYRFIDAAILAGVRRYMASEFGLNNMRPDAQALSTVFRDKGAVQAYLRAQADAGKIEWMSVSCGMWVAWSLVHRFMGTDVPNLRFEMLDGGEGLASVTTEANTALAIVRALVAEPELTRNRNILLQDFAVSQKQLLAEIEKQLGKKLEVVHLDSAKVIEEKNAEFAAGDQNAQYGLINVGFMTGRYGGLLEKEGELLNEKLGLAKTSLEAEVAEGLRRLAGN